MCDVYVYTIKPAISHLTELLPRHSHMHPKRNPNYKAKQALIDARYISQNWILSPSTVRASLSKAMKASGSYEEDPILLWLLRMTSETLQNKCQTISVVLPNVLRAPRHEQHLFRGKVNGASRTCKTKLHAREKQEKQSSRVWRSDSICIFCVLREWVHCLANNRVKEDVL